MTSTRVKICGVSTAEIMHAVVDGGADYVGLVFFPKSPRNVSLAEAAELAEIARGTVTIVALVVDPSDAMLDDIVTQVGPDLLQLHGSETPDRCREIKARWPVGVMKVIGVGSAVDVLRADQYIDAVDLVMFDAKPPKTAVLPGGNGVTFDWSLLAGVGLRMDFMLSGGLTPETVASAIAATGAVAVDVSSGVESSPGVKDAALVQRFIAAAKAQAIA